ncbi:porin [Granulosicoccus antarcticus]|uniref:Porin domain-containing protein n=1 Tax=Granulosicoccus antarcticus IMCC3135 TaxID=1192854 RepID=A0A2Z2NLY4_9GAMM|nr:porin [Granulosicoccus antarcticus]ASJ71555.1 hypothetical protein IMCC3135_07245 [Granulosicoccus antarcticus IMCC3135]
MKGNLLAVAALSCSLASGVALAQEQFTSELDASLRLGLGLNTEPDAELTFENYSSRIRWRGAADAGEGLKAISYLEFGFDQDTGVSNTRYAWLGLEGDFGTIKGGKQYRAFYDAVTAAVDIAYWGSCFTENACSRQSSVLKFSSPETEDLQYMASVILVPNDAGNDFIDGLDIGAKMQSGDMTFGAGLALLIGNDADVGVLDDDDFFDFGTGFALGTSVTMPISEGTASASLQYASDDYIQESDDAVVLTATYAKDQMYGLVGFSSADNSPFYLTLGYEKPLIEKKAFAYFEVSAVDDGVDEFDDFGFIAGRSDLDLQVRAVMVFNMDLLSMAK